jgi:predicted permease
VPLLVKVRSVLRNLFSSQHVETDLDQEVQSHLEMLTEENTRAGMSPKEAHRAARIELGGIEQLKEQVREERIGNWLHSVIADCRYGVRQLRKNPGFTAVAILTVALGVGANTAIFSIVNWVLIRPLAVANPGQLTYLAYQQKGADGWNNGFSYPDLEEIRTQAASAFSGIAGDQAGQMVGLDIDGKTQPIWADFVTNNFFDVLGGRPALGNLTLPSTESFGSSEPVLVLSESFWKKQLSSDPSIVGKKAFVNGHAVTIIGIAPPGFSGLTSWMDTQGYLPIGLATIETGVKDDFFADRLARNLLLIARLNPQTRLREVQPLLDLLANRLTQQHPKSDGAISLRAFPLGPSGPSGDPLADPLPKIAWLFLLLAAFVLVLACVNVGNLILIRGAARQREMAVRAALGAARGRLIRQLLTESLVIALLGCIAGILVGIVANRALSSMQLGTDLPLVIDPHVDWRVFAYAFGAAIVTGIVVGITPAVRASGRALTGIMHKGGSARTDKNQRLRSIVAVVQVAASLTLLIVAGLFARSLAYVQRIDLGFDPHNVLNLTIDPHDIGYSQAQGLAFYKELRQRVRTLPGVQSASLASLVPMGSEVDGDDLQIPGYQSTDSSSLHARYNAVSEDYFKTMRIPLLQGRDFSDSDNESTPRVAIINEAMADRFWPGQSSIGRLFSTGDDPSHPISVIGVVKNSRNYDFSGAFGPYFYIPLTQHYASSQTLQLRTTAPPENIAPSILAIVHSLVSEMPVFNVKTMTSAVNGMNGFLPFQFGAVLTSGLGALGMALAIVGVYGVISYAASLRTHEIGIRMALGAEPLGILKMILRQALLIVIVGVICGLLAAFVVSRLMADFLVGVLPTDAATYASVTVLLAAVVLFASYIPARRATRVDPMVALRYE